MSYTNTTSHYGLPQYLATDKPKYLTDFNETMSAIDTQMYTNATAAATADGKAVSAQNKADANESSIATLNTQINGDVSDPSDTGLAGDVSALEGSVNTINSLIGNGEPTTTDKTIIGAINELAADDGDLSTLTTTEKSSLVGAINEVAASVPDAADKWVLKAHNQSVVGTHDGTKTNLQVIGDLVTAFNALTANLATGEFIRPIRVAVGNKGMALFYFRDFPKNDVCNVQAFNAIVNNTPNSADFWTIYISNAPKFVSGTFGGSASDTWVDEGAQVATEDITIFYDVYHKA